MDKNQKACIVSGAAAVVMGATTNAMPKLDHQELGAACFAITLALLAFSMRKLWLTLKLDHA